MRDDETGVGFGIADRDARTRVQDLKIQVQMPSGKIFGPYARREILMFIQKRKIRGQEKILVSGETLWRPIASDPEFFDALHALISGAKKDGDDEADLEAPVSTTVVQKVEEKVEDTSVKDQATKVVFEKTLVSKETLSNEDIARMKAEKRAMLPPTRPTTPSEEGLRPLHLTPPKAIHSIKKDKKKFPMILGGVIVALIVVSYLSGIRLREELPKDSPSVGINLTGLGAGFAYGTSLDRALTTVDLRIGAPPETFTQNRAVRLGNSFNAAQWTRALHEALSVKDPEELQSAAYWTEIAWYLHWLGPVVQLWDRELGRKILEGADRITKALRAKGALGKDMDQLLKAVVAYQAGDWEEVRLVLQGLDHPWALWLREDASWWSFWVNGASGSYQDEQEPFEDGRLEITSQIRRNFMSKSPTIGNWLIQLSSDDPQSIYLWFTAAQLQWRGGGPEIQFANRHFITGLTSLAIYPPAVQIAVWTQFGEFLSKFARKETQEKAQHNLELLSKGDLKKRRPEWWDIGHEGLGAQAIAEETLAAAGKGQLSPRDVAALLVFGRGLTKGASYLSVVGQDLIFQGRIGPAKELFAEAHRQDSRSAEALGGLIWSSSLLYDFASAQDAYDKLASLGQTQFELRYKGLIYFLGREFENAQQAWDEQLTRFPNDAWTHYFKAQLEREQKKKVDCVKSANLAKLQATGELEFQAERLLALCRIEAGIAVRETLELMSAAIRKEPNSIPLRSTYISGLQIAQLARDGIRVARESLDSFPRSAELRLQLAELLEREGDTEEAVREYQRAAQTDSSSAEAWVRIGNILERQGGFKEAARNFETAASLQPSYPEVFIMAARAWEKAKEPKKAAAAYQREIEARPGAMGTFIEAAEFFLKNNSPMEVVELYKSFEEGGYREDPNALVRVAQAYNILGDMLQAKEAASRAVSLDPKNAHFNYVLGNILERTGEHILAKTYYERYLDLLPMAPDAAELKAKISRPPFSND
jgi:tetratricopeptide (TPR) repeat protein